MSSPSRPLAEIEKPAIAWKKRATRWKPSSLIGFALTSPTANDVLTAIVNKDAFSLAAILAEHPGMLQEPFVFRAVQPANDRHGLLAHILLHLEWPEALDVLFAAGDRFDQQSPQFKATHRLGGLTALEETVVTGNTVAARRMLALGSDPNGEPHQPPLACLNLAAGHSNRPPRRALTRQFLAAGADPWRRADRLDAKPLALGLLANGRTQCARWLLEESHQPPTEIQASLAWDSWLNGCALSVRQGWIERADHAADHIVCAQRLITLGFGKPPWLSCWPSKPPRPRIAIGLPSKRRWEP